MTVAQLISKFLSHYTFWQLYCPSCYLHMAVIWAYKTRVQLWAECGWRMLTVHHLAADELEIDAQFLTESSKHWFANISRVSLVKLPVSRVVLSHLCRHWLWMLLCLCIWIAGWMCFPPVWTPWAPSRRRTLTAWRSSSSIMTSTTAGTWQQRLTGIMRTVQHGSSSAHASRLSQVCYTSGPTNVHVCMVSTCTYVHCRCVMMVETFFCHNLNIVQ